MVMASVVLALIRVCFVVSCSMRDLVSCPRDIGAGGCLSGMMRCSRRVFCISCVSSVAVRVSL